MKRDKSADKRYEYNVEITNKEREIDELHKKQREDNRVMENFDDIMMQNFRIIQEINEDIEKRSHVQNVINEIGERKSYMIKFNIQQQEETEQMYRKANQVLEDEHQQLQREKDDLPWD